jgi:hypothetical protein
MGKTASCPVGNDAALVGLWLLKRRGFKTKWGEIAALAVAAPLVFVAARYSAVAGAVVVAVAAAGAFISAVAVAILDERAKSHGLRPFFLCFFWLCMMAAVLFPAPALLAPLSTWKVCGPVLLFFGVLTLINAPFDWLSLGIPAGCCARG